MTINARGSVEVILNLFVCLGITAVVGCDAPERSKEVSTAKVSSIDSVNSTALTRPMTATAGPRLLVDSSATDPVMKLENGTLIVHLPSSMAGVLNDSLPGFELVPRSAYDTLIVRWMDGRKERELPSIGEPASDSDWPAALSVAIGDFDGDSKPDIAMKGIARDSAATVFLLGRSTSRPEPRLIFVGRPQPADRGTPEWVFLVLVRPGPVREFDEGEGSSVVQLRTDAVEIVYFEKASEVFYLDGGELRSFATSD